MIEIRSLTAGIESASVLKNCSLTVRTGEIAVVMGPNGSGKSTLAHVVAGHPSYQVEGGEILVDGEDIVTLEPEERAARGVFLAFQYPASIPGVSVSHFLRLALNAQEKARGKPATSVADFIKQLRAGMKALRIPNEFAQRSVNDGFSGGEKKRLEMLQMLILRPRIIILDEIDSGLDIDAIKLVAEAVNNLERSETSILLITHYQRLLNYIRPDTVHIMKEGRVATSGGPELALQLEQEGYAKH